MAVIPSARQLRHHGREFYGFVHFTTNTFTDKEWGFGDESPQVFNPTAFDAGQIADSAKIAGMRGLILTCKHHDGFCLWPSEFTEHSVKNCSWRGGKGDVVGELAQACREVGMEFGVYLSPWDRNHAEYGTGKYIEYYRAQLRELLTNYGEIFEVWFDGANGGDGFYGGANEKRSIDNRTYYDWDSTWKIVRELQPDAVMFSDAGPDVRWVGNEAGIAGDPCWCTIKAEGMMPGQADRERLNTGDRDGETWLLPECNVSIRPGWFYHAAEDGAVRTGKNLVDLYFASVGRGANFLVNLPPDRRGLVHEMDRESLKSFRRHLDALFAKNLAAGRVRQLGWQSAEGGGGSEDDGREWCIQIDMTQAQRVSVIELREDIRTGHRVDAWGLEMEEAGGRWRQLAGAEAVGPRRLVRFAPATGRKFRLRLRASDEPMISALGLYLEPELKETPVLQVDSVAARVVRASEDDVVLDLGKVMRVKALRYAPSVEHRADRYEIALAESEEAWGRPKAGEFGNMMFHGAPQTVALETETRFVRFKAVRFCAGSKLSADEVRVIR